MTDLSNKELLRPDEVARFWRVSVKTVYRWIDMGIIPGVKKGGTVRVPREDVEQGEGIME